MLVSFDKAATAFLKVRRIRERWRELLIAGDRPVVSIEEYQLVIEDMYGLRIEKRVVTFEGEHLRGMVERYRSNRARVLIRMSQSEDWKKFTTAKELTHLVIDEEEDWSPRGAETLDSLMYEIQVGNGDVVPNEVIQSEVLAALTAIEVVYPIEWRETDIRRIEEGETTVERLALDYRLPPGVVYRALRPDHMRTCRDLWARANEMVPAAA